MNLVDLKREQKARILSVGGPKALRQHFLDMGLIPGTIVEYIKEAPMGDPIEFRVFSYELTLRISEAEQIKVELLSEGESRQMETERIEKKAGQKGKRIEEDKKNTYKHHPGLGENGIFHGKNDGEELSKDTLLTFGLAGNQNCGKTTLFNQLTGSNQHVGNFPGVTVDRKDGPIRKQENTQVTDLPGIYSMSPYTSEEIVTREFFLNDPPKGIINIVDATNIERNMYLTMQLIELNIPMVLALNMMDEVRENGGTIDVNALEEALGIPVVPISAAKNEGIDELVSHAMHVAHYQERPRRQDFCEAEGVDGGAMHRCIHSIMHLIEDHAKRAGIPVRFAATKIVEKDTLIEEKLQLSQNEKEMLEHIIFQLEEESGMDRQAALAFMRFKFINTVCEKAVVKPRESKEHKRSQKIDRVLTGKYTAIPVFVGIMVAIFVMTFGFIGAKLSELTELGIEAITNGVDMLLTRMDVSYVLHSLIIDGIFEGVGSVLTFLPTIVTLFFFLSILEDSGYMARVAFVMDKLLRKIGLSGRSFVPMIIGFGCSVPAIMATRTLPSERDRKMTILLTPFMSCSAKLPIYAFFSAVFFPNHGALIMSILYFGGILVGVLYALILDKTIFKGEPVPFVMELPNYRIPAAKSVGRLIWDKAKDFANKAFTIIFLATIVVWFLQSFDTKLQLVTDSADSMLASLGSMIAPIFTPLGLNDWRISTALLTGFMAKESVVSTITILAKSSGVTSLFSGASAFVFLVFTLLYTPCVAAIASVKRELGGKWAVLVVIMQCIVAFIVSFFVNLLIN